MPGIQLSVEHKSRCSWLFCCVTKSSSSQWANRRERGWPVYKSWSYRLVHTKRWVSEAALTLLKHHKVKTVWFQKWVCTRNHMPTFWSTTKNLLHELLFMGPLKLVGSHGLDRDPASVACLHPPKHWSVVWVSLCRTKWHIVHFIHSKARGKYDYTVG